MCEQGKKADYIEESDLSLIRQCRGGSQRAAAALIARYAGLVHMSVSRAGGGFTARGIYGTYECYSFI